MQLICDRSLFAYDIINPSRIFVQGKMHLLNAGPVQISFQGFFLLLSKKDDLGNRVATGYTLPLPVGLLPTEREGDFVSTSRKGNIFPDSRRRQCPSPGAAKNLDFAKS